MKKFGKIVSVIVLLCGMSFVNAAEKSFSILKDGKLVVEFITPKDDKACLEASMIIEKYIYKSSGQRADAIVSDAKIYFQIEKGKMDLEGFRFSFPAPGKMVISAGGPNGIKYAALDFCERFMGVRFLYPGPAGEHVPKLKNLSIPMKEFSDAPKFTTRTLGAGNNHWSRKRYQDWFPLHRGAMPYRLAITHNLYKMFPPSKYAKTNPDFYPIIDGKRYIPRPPRLGLHWQPCMTNPAVVKEAVRMICEAFAKDPDLRTWSLAQNDGDGYCECANCKKFYPNPDVRHRFGSKDRSMLYLQFCNKIAEGVTKKYPEAKFAIYAYNHTSIAPKDYKLHPSLVPVITYDRLNWVDPERKAKDMIRQSSWSAIADSVAWYDYFYSNQYVLPRITTHHVARQLREGYKLRVRHVYIEHLPLGISGFGGNEQIWAEGPLSYVVLKMLWNPFQDEDKILDDWYKTAVGPKAAPYLKRYFDRVENFWLKQMPKSSWFARCARTYLVPTWHDYLTVIDKDFFEKSAEDLDKVCELAPAGDCKIRAEYFRHAFQNRRNRCEYWIQNQKVRLYNASAFTKVFFKEDFNKGMKDWGVYEHRLYPGRFITHTAKDGYKNTGAVELQCRPGHTGGVEKTFRITEPKNFRIQVRYRCVGTTEKIIPYISAEWCDDKNEILHSVFYSDIHGVYSEDWTTAAFNFTTPYQLPGYLRIRLCNTGSPKGKLQYDDVIIWETPKK